MLKRFAPLALAAVSAPAYASFQLNEIFINPPGTDNGLEFFEITGAANASLSNVWFLVVEGDGTGAGTVDVAINLTGQSTGSNGLFLRRDAATAISWNNPDNNWAATSGALSGTNVQVGDFNPDIENGSNTFMLVTGFTGAVGTDYDSNDDGVFNAGTPWTSVVDAVGLTENDSTNLNVQYATGVGGFGFAADPNFNADLLFRARNWGGAGTSWVGSDVLGTGTGVFTVDGTRYATQNPFSAPALSTISNWTATPGGMNPVPEPATLAALGIGVAALIRRKKNAR